MNKQKIFLLLVLINNSVTKYIQVLGISVYLFFMSFPIKHYSEERWLKMDVMLKIHPCANNGKQVTLN